MRLHNLFALLQVTTVGLSASSLQYLNYPTQVYNIGFQFLQHLAGILISIQIIPGHIQILQTDTHARRRDRDPGQEVRRE